MSTASFRSTLRRARHLVIQAKNVVVTRRRLRGVELGPRARIDEGNVLVENNGRITIGADTRLHGPYAPVELRTAAAGWLSIGERCWINFGVSIHAADTVRIGDGVQLGPYCVVSDCEAGALDSPIGDVPRPVEIGDGAWLATRVIVRPGSSIGAGTVVAAGSVVDGDLPADSVAAGNPARVVRTLNQRDRGPGAESDTRRVVT